MTSASSKHTNDELLAATNQKIRDALRRLESEVLLPLSVSSLAKLSGVHRNTIYNHDWPLVKLKAIKEKRKQDEKAKAASEAVQKSPAELLELSRLEVVYWFTQVVDARNSKMELANRMEETEASRSYYMSLAQQRLMQLNEQTLLIAKLRDALDAQEEEITILKSRLGA